jgi:hypothetical protein
MQSYTRGPQGAIVRTTIGEAFLQTANRFPERVALISRRVTRTRCSVLRRACGPLD